MAVRHGVLDRSATTGMTGITTRNGLLALNKLMESGAGPQAMVVAMNWNQYAENPVAAWQKRLLSEIDIHDARRAPAAGAARRKPESWVEKLKAAGKLQERELLRNLLEERICTTLRLPREETINSEQPLHELGLDSLLAIELRNSVGMSLHRSLPATLLFDYPTLRALTDYLLSLVGTSESSRPKQSRANPNHRSVLEDIEALSDDEVNEMLSQQAARTRQEV
jgi:acyl carrier protein